jgi:hypothetical protein
MIIRKDYKNNDSTNKRKKWIVGFLLIFLPIWYGSFRSLID